MTKQTANTALGLFGLFAVGWMVTHQPASNTRAVEPAKVEVVNSEAANIGDTVTVPYPHSTMLCKNKDEANQLYMVGINALAQTMRVENSMSTAVAAEFEAQKKAMARLYSCQWAMRDTRYTVVHKEINGAEKPDTYWHTVSYCLKPVNGDACLWLYSPADLKYSPIAKTS